MNVRRGVLLVFGIMVFSFLIPSISAFHQNVSLSVTDHLGSNRPDVFDLDGTYYLADMKDSSKNFYLNFTSNITNGSILSLFAKQNKGVAVGVYAQSDTLGSNPLGNFTVTSVTGEWYNITLDLNESTNAIWLGEGTGSGTDPNEEFDFIQVLLADSSPPNISIISPLNQSYNTNSILVNLSSSSSILDATWFYNGSTNITYTSPILHTFSQGSTTLIAYANDTSGNLNSTNVTFFVDSVAPVVSLAHPQNKTYGINTSLPLNFSVSDLTGSVDSCWYNLERLPNSK